MITKLLWCALMCIVVIGILFFSSIGITIPEAYYEQRDSILMTQNGG